MGEFATFTAPGGGDPVAHIQQMQAAVVTTTGDMLLCGQIVRSRIVQRTTVGTDMNGAPFTPYSTKGPYYFYPNGPVGRSHEERAKQTARRFKAIGSKGHRTPLGIRYESYADAKASHGRANVDLFNLIQEPHMMNGIAVKAGGSEIDMAGGDIMSLGASSELDAWGQNQPCREVRVGLYDEALAERARGNDEGTEHVPQRKFLGANPEDLDVCRVAVTERMIARMKGHK